MNPKRRALVTRSWEIARPQGVRVAELFYQKLFEIAPSTRVLFASTDMQLQGHKVIAMLEEIVRFLDDPNWLVGHVAPLGHRHVWYGVEAGHYDFVRDALLAALAEVVGDAFDDDMRAAWSETYALIAALMQRGAGATRPVM